MGIHMIKTLFVFLVLLNFFHLRYEKHSKYEIINSFASASEIISPNVSKIETWGVYFRGSHAPHHFNTTAEVVLAKPSHACSKLKEDYQGKIVLIDSNNCDPQVKAKNAQNANATGVMIAEYRFHPALTYLTDGKNHPDLTVPTVQVGTSDFALLKHYLAQNASVMVQLEPDPNPWDKTYGNRLLWIIYVSLIAVAFAGVFAFACYRLYQYKVRKEDAKAKLVILILVAVFCLECIVGWLDPIGSLGIYSYKVSTLLSSIHFPFGLTIYFLLVLYWAEVTKGFTPNFTKIMKPFACVTPLFFLAEFISWVPRFMFYDTGMILMGLLLMYVVGFALATVFYLKNGIQIIMALNRQTKILAKPSAVKKLTFYILFIAGCHALDTIMFAVYIVVGIGPIFNPCLYWIHAALTFAVTLSEVLMFPDVQSSNTNDVELQQYNVGMGPTQSSTLSDAAATGSSTLSETE